MAEDRTPMGCRFYRQGSKDAAPGRIFCPLDTPTLTWLAERANGRPLGEVAAELLREMACKAPG